MSDPIDIYVNVHRVEAGTTYTVEVEGKSGSATASSTSPVQVKIAGVSQGSHYIKAGDGKFAAHGINAHVGPASYQFDIYM